MVKFPYKLHLLSNSKYWPANDTARDLAENINVYEQRGYMDFPENGMWARQPDINGLITVPAAALKIIGIGPFDKVFVSTTLSRCEVYITKVSQTSNSVLTVKQKTVDCYNNVKVQIDDTMETEYLIGIRGDIISIQPL